MSPKLPALPAAIDSLLGILDLEPLEQNLFRGTSPKDGWQRVYGGQVLGQALVAAVRTVDEPRPVHSLHAYFLLAGDPAKGRAARLRRVTSWVRHRCRPLIAAPETFAESGRQPVSRR